MSSELHHRSHELLRKYWEKLRGDRKYPQESEIDSEALADIWKSCFLVCIDEVTRSIGYRYSYLGTDLIEAYGDDIKNPEVALRLISTSSMPTIKRFDEVIARQAPVIDESEFVNLKGVKIRYRTCLLPLGKQGNITHILGCMRWKIY